MKFWRQKNGFTLLEVLIATGLFAIAAVVVANGVLFSSDVNVRDRRLAQAAFLANQKMIEIETRIYDDMSKGVFPEEESEGGAFEEPHAAYKWQMNVKKVEIPFNPGDEKNAIALAVVKQVIDKISESVREMSVTVTWVEDEDAAEPQELRLVTHIVKE